MSSNKWRLFRKPSGEVPQVKEFRAKMESISDNQLPDLVAVREQLEAMAAGHTTVHPADTEPNTPVIHDPRRESNSSIPPDVVELEAEPDPFPSLPPEKKKP